MTTQNNPLKRVKTLNKTVQTEQQTAVVSRPYFILYNNTPSDTKFAVGSGNKTDQILNAFAFVRVSTQSIKSNDIEIIFEVDDSLETPISLSFTATPKTDLDVEIDSEPKLIATTPQAPGNYIIENTGAIDDDDLPVDIYSLLENRSI